MDARPGRGRLHPGGRGCQFRPSGASAAGSAPTQPGPGAPAGPPAATRPGPPARPGPIGAGAPVGAGGPPTPGGYPVPGIPPAANQRRPTPGAQPVRLAPRHQIMAAAPDGPIPTPQRLPRSHRRSRAACLDPVVGASASARASDRARSQPAGWRAGAPTRATRHGDLARAAADQAVRFAGPRPCQQPPVRPASVQVKAAGRRRSTGPVLRPAVQPRTIQPRAVQPRTAQPRAVQPRVAQPWAVQPWAVQTPAVQTPGPACRTLQLTEAGRRPRAAGQAEAPLRAGWQARPAVHRTNPRTPRDEVARSGSRRRVAVVGRPRGIGAAGSTPDRLGLPAATSGSLRPPASGSGPGPAGQQRCWGSHLFGTRASPRRAGSASTLQDREAPAVSAQAAGRLAAASGAVAGQEGGPSCARHHRSERGMRGSVRRWIGQTVRNRFLHPAGGGPAVVRPGPGPDEPSVIRGQAAW